MTIEDKLGTLKMKLVAQNDLTPIWDYFMDEFSENDQFPKTGSPLADSDEIDPVVPLVAQAAAAAVFKPDEDKVSRFIPIHILQY